MNKPVNPDLRKVWHTAKDQWYGNRLRHETNMQQVRAMRKRVADLLTFELGVDTSCRFSM
jgi:hypothetical protein